MERPWVPLNKYKLAVPKPQTELYKRNLSHSGNVLWNSLTAVIDIPLNMFLREIKNLNLEICNILAQPPCKASFLLLFL